jgi:hypothetical protein|tara:strand:+ start:12705 stop:12944 length:240 start_codon:yes stop_codon:yes gene_type:complete
MEVKKDAWDNFIANVMDPESDTSNFKFSFKIMSKKYGQAYIVFCRAMWEANEGVMSEDEFMAMNGEMPRAFFEKVISNP